MSENMNRADAVEIIHINLEMLAILRNILNYGVPELPEHKLSKLIVEDRALKLLAKLSQPQSLGSPQE